MSLALYMEPVKPPEPTYLGGHPVKGLICRAFGQHDGSLCEAILLTRDHLGALNAVQRLHPDVPELQQIIDALQEHGLVRLWTDE